ncbi:MAG TPA: 7-cyano-7-deazaguanine synthase QueC [Terriglobales bacterium]|nr:7-cyano-7-deazaguanine synthase QueC [Terriglobales bacterium]
MAERHEKRKAVVLLSGGLDSATVLAIACREGFTPHALSFDYGQRHAIELQSAKRLATMFGAEHSIINFDLRRFGGSALTADIDVPKDRAEAQMASGVPVTYVPARNTIFLSFALGLAEVIGANDIFVGVNVLDYSGYPDCRPEFIDAFQKLAKVATKSGIEGQPVTIHTPLIQMTKAEIIKTGIALGLDYSATSSCYDPSPDGRACGRCDSCQLRRKGFAEAGIPDPTRYQ